MTTELEGYRFRNDDGSEAAATWLAAQDTAATVLLGTRYRCRAIINTTGDEPATAYRWEWKESTSSVWTPMSTSGAVALAQAYTEYSTNFTQADGALPYPWSTGWGSGGTADVLSNAMRYQSQANQNPVVIPDYPIYANSGYARGKLASNTAVGTNYHQIVFRAEATTGFPCYICTFPTSTAIVEWFRITDNAGTGFESIQTGTLTGLTIGDTVGITWTGTGNNTVVSVWRNPTATKPFDVSNWDSSSDPADLTFTNNPVTPCNDGGNPVGQGGNFAGITDGVCGPSVFCSTGSITWDDWSHGDFAVAGRTTNIQPYGLTQTTPQLTAPSGKATSDHVTGWATADMNPPFYTLNITADDYSEQECCFILQSPATLGRTYQLRLTKNGTAFDTYTVTPQMSVAGASSAWFRG